MIHLQDEFQIQVHGYNWTIRFVPPSHPELEGNMGITIFTKNLILIDNSLDVDPSRGTLMHEICHSVLGSAGLGIKKDDESICDLIGLCLTKTLETMDIKLLSFLLGRGLQLKKIRKKK